MSLDKSHYDVAILSTGLTQSILSAALASAGLTVLHIDKNDYYADQWASLTLSELAKWASSNTHERSQRAAPARRVDDVSLDFPAFDALNAQKPGQSSQLPESLASLDRHYAISLAPTLLPATGPSIDCLISSRVSSYATFRLLERTCVAFVPKGNADRPTLTSVPASKEDIFKTKALSLIAKRKLMKLLMYIGAEDWQSELSQNPALAKRPFVEYLAEVHQMPPDLVDAVAYGVCLCATPLETTEMAMSRAKSHMQSVGRYGNSAYLVGQYGGAGELAQGYCRASAVKGAMFILDHRITSARRDQQDAHWEIQVDGVDTLITADYLVSSDEALEELGLHSRKPDTTASPATVQTVLHKAVLVFDRPLRFSTGDGKETGPGVPIPQDAAEQEQVSSSELPPETGLVVFPPGSVGGNANTVTVLMMGEGTFSCPKGQYVYYVQTEAGKADGERSTLHVLQPVIDRVLALSSDAGQTTETRQSPARPLLQLTYRQIVPCSAVSTAYSNLSSIPFPPTSQALGTGSAVTSISVLTDSAVHLAEQVYYDILASRASSHASAGSSHESKVRWIKQMVETQRQDRKRRKGRDISEYKGRGGRGVDDGITKEKQDEMAEPKESGSTIVGFFESSLDQDTDDLDEEVD